MTTPDGVPNLPVGALTLENLAAKLQDQTVGAVRNLASERMPAIFDASTGGAILSDLTPFGIITHIWAGFISVVRNADPNDINGPEDLPGLLQDFIEGLPVIGQLVGLLQAILGLYDGDDAVLLAVQQIFFPIRKLLQLISGQPVGFPTVEEVTIGWTNLGDALVDATSAAAEALEKLIHVNALGLYDAAAGFANQATSLLKNLVPTGGNIGQFDAAGLAGTLNSSLMMGSAALSTIFNGSGQFIGVLNSSATGALNSAITYGGTALSTVLTNITASTGALNAAGLTGALNGAVTFGGTTLSTLLQYLNSSGAYNASQLTGALNTGLTFSGTALSTLLQYLNSSGQFNAAQLQGALANTVTYGGTALSTFLQNINSSGQLLAPGITGALGTGLTVGGTTLGTLFTNINSSGQVIASGITGALGTGLTVGGTTLGTLFTNINSSGQLLASGIFGDITRGMSTDMQATIDALANAFTGGTYGIPQTAAPTYGSTGAGKTWNNSNNSWAHTVVGNAILVFCVYADTNPSVPAFSVNGANIPLLNSFIYNTAGGNWVLAVYGLMSPSTGAQTVSCTAGSDIAFAANSVSYSGVSSLGTVVTATGTGTALSHTVTALSTDLVVQAFSDFLQTLTGYNRNQRSLQPGVGGVNLVLLIGDESTTLTSIPFTATGGFSETWGSIAVPLHGITTTNHASASIIASALASIPGSLLTGALNTAVTIGGQAISSLFNGSGQFIGVLNSAATGALNSAITYGGTALSTVLTNITASTGALNAAGITGAFNTAATISGNSLSTLFNSSGLIASQITGALNTAVTIGGNPISTIFNGSGLLNGSQITGALNTALTIGGNALSTIFNGSGLLNGSQITGAINTAATLGGNAVSTLFNGSGVIASQISGALNNAITINGTSFNTLIPSGQLAASQVSGALNTAVTVAGQTVGTVQSNAQGIVNGINNAAAGLISGGSTAMVDAQTNIQALFAAPVQFLQGLGGGSIFSQAANNAAYAAAAAAQAAAAAELARQTSAFNAVFNVSPTSAGNVNVSVDFSGMANAANMSGVPMSPGSTNIGITSGAAARQVSTTGSDSEVFPTVTTTNYQAITITLGPLNDLLSGSVPTAILCRCNSARTIMTRLVINVNGGVPVVSLDAEISGSVTPIVSNVAVPTMASGGVVKIFLGDPSSISPNAIQLLYNGTPIITTSSGVPTVGASNRYVGFKMFCNSAGKYPPGIRSVVYQDNPPAPSSYPYSGLPVVGTKGRMYWPNDVGLALRDNGAAWETVWGGVLGAFTPPPSSGWSWTNQGAASVATALGGEVLTAPSSTRNWRLRTRTLTPASNYSATFYMENTGLAPASTNGWYAGVILKQSNAFISFGPSYTSAASLYTNLAIVRWTNATTVSAASFQSQSYTLPGGVIPNWYRIADDGSNRYFQVSLNGVDWITLFSEGRTAFITPNEIGFGGSNEGTGQGLVVRCRSMSGVS